MVEALIPLVARVMVVESHQMAEAKARVINFALTVA
jgi:hypothetical protein